MPCHEYKQVVIVVSSFVSPLAAAEQPKYDWHNMAQKGPKSGMDQSEAELHACHITCVPFGHFLK